MPITEQELEAAKASLRSEFSEKIAAALQELSVQITESHNRVVEAATTSSTTALESAKEAIGTHDESLKKEIVILAREAASAVIAATVGEHEDECRKALEHQLQTIRQEMVPPLVVPVPTGDGELLLRFEKQRLYLDDLADRLGQPRMEAN